MRGRTVIGLTGVLVLAAAMTAGAQQTGVRAAVEAAGRTFSDAVARKDAAKLAGLYTSDAEAFPPNADVVRGRDAIQKLWQGVLDSGIAAAALTTRDVESSGDIAWETGTYELKGADGATVDRGKYVVVWKRVQGQWLILRDIWNSSVPAPAK